MTRFIRILAVLAMVLGLVMALPGLLLLLASGQLSSMAMDRDQEDRDRALYTADLAPDSEPR